MNFSLGEAKFFCHKKIGAGYNLCTCLLSPNVFVITIDNLYVEHSWNI